MAAHTSPDRASWQVNPTKGVFRRRKKFFCEKKVFWPPLKATNAKKI
jgi:hypothetical protein